MLELLAYVEDSSDECAGRVRSPLVKETHRKVTEVKQSREMEAEYMTLFLRDQENIERGRVEGREEGRTAERTELIANMYQNHFSFEQIALATQISVDEVKALIRDMPAPM